MSLSTVYKSVLTLFPPGTTSPTALPTPSHRERRSTPVNTRGQHGFPTRGDNHKFEENNLTGAINSTKQDSKKTELRGPTKDCKVNVISLKKFVKDTMENLGHKT